MVQFYIHDYSRYKTGIIHEYSRIYTMNIHELFMVKKAGFIQPNADVVITLSFSWERVFRKPFPQPSQGLTFP